MSRVITASILIADDDASNAHELKQLFSRDGHHVVVVTSAPDALRACALAPPDVVVIDLVAHGDGFAVCLTLKEQPETRLLPVVIVTSPSQRADRLRAIECGADDFLTLPFDPLELRARIQSLVRLKRYTDELESAESVILGLGATIEARDPDTQGHCQRLASYARLLGRKLALDVSDLGALERGGFLHDIGKIAVPDCVLLKGGTLDEAEYRVMREHPIVGDALCSGLRSLRNVRPIVRHHHERLDGTGYPDGLRNSGVPLLAQIIGMVDVFDALTHRRPYRQPVPSADALQMLTDEADRGWRDRALVDALAEVVGDRELGEAPGGRTV